MKAKLNDYPDYRAAAAKLTELQGELAGVELARAAGLHALSSEPTPADKLTVKALKLLGGGTDEQPDRAERVREIETLAERRRVLERAIELPQRAEVNRIQSETSREICKALRPEYVRLVKELATSAKALAKAAEAERLFRETLKEGDVTFASYLPPVPLRGGWDRADNYSPLQMLLREAKASGYL